PQDYYGDCANDRQCKRQAPGVARGRDGWNIGRELLWPQKLEGGEEHKRGKQQDGAVLGCEREPHDKASPAEAPPPREFPVAVEGIHGPEHEEGVARTQGRERFSKGRASRCGSGFEPWSASPAAARAPAPERCRACSGYPATRPPGCGYTSCGTPWRGKIRCAAPSKSVPAERPGYQKCRHSHTFGPRRAQAPPGGPSYQSGFPRNVGATTPSQGDKREITRGGKLRG